MPTTEVFLSGVRVNVSIDRDSQFTLTITSTAGGTLSDAVVELKRSRVEGLRSVASSLIPVPTVAVDELSATAVFTAVMTGALNDLATDGHVAFFRYRMRAKINDGALQTFASGVLAVGPIGFGKTGTNLTIPYAISTGNIVVGDITVTPPGEDPGDPDPPGDTLADATLWEAEFAEAWETGNYVQWA